MRNIYLVSATQTHDYLGYDTFDSFVVVCEDEARARRIHPQSHWGGPLEEVKDEDYCSTWSKFKDLNELDVEFIGTTDENVERVVCASFNAG